MTRRIDVLHVTPGLITGGAETALARLVADREHGLRHRILVLGPTGPLADELPEDVELHCLHLEARNPVRALRGLASVLRDAEPDILHGWMYLGNLAASLLTTCLVGRPRVIWGIRGSLHDAGHMSTMARTSLSLNRFGSRLPDAIVYNSHTSREHHESAGFEAIRGSVIANGFDTARFAPDVAAGGTLRSELGIDEQAVLFGHFARKDPIKDQSGLLAAFTRIAEEVDAHLVLAGDGMVDDDPELKPAADSAAHGRVHTIGVRRDMPHLHAAIDCFVLNSRSESFPNTVAEAMACGTPCISTQVGDAAHIIGETGLLVPPGSVDALTTAMTTIARMTTAERQRRGSDARHRIIEHFDRRRCHAAWRRCYERLLEAGVAA